MRAFKENFVAALAFTLVVCGAGIRADDSANRDEKRVTGDWFGYIEGDVMRQLWHLQVFDEKTKLRGELTVARWGDSAWPIVVSRNGDHITFELTTEGNVGRFGGDLGRNELRGTYNWRGIPYNLRFGRLNRLGPPQGRPQVPQPPFNYSTLRVSFSSRGVELPALLTVPTGAVRAPAVLFMNGSDSADADPQLPGDPDPVILPWVICDLLSRAGIATLRVCDRGTGGVPGDKNECTLSELGADGLCAIKFLSRRPDVDKDHLGIVGISLGGALAPMIAIQANDVRFVVMLSAPSLPHGSFYVEAQRRLWNRKWEKYDQPDKERIRTTIDRDLERLRHFYHDLQGDMSPDLILERVRKYENTVSEPFRMRDDKIREMVSISCMPLKRDMIRTDPRIALHSLSISALAIYGARDELIPADLNGPAMEKALKANKAIGTTVRILPGLAHGLYAISADLVPVDDNDIDPVVLRLICDWILTVTHQK